MREEKSQAFENKEVREMQVRGGAQIQKDVKNEGWPDYRHENTGPRGKCTLNAPAFLTKKPWVYAIIGVKTEGHCQGRGPTLKVVVSFGSGTGVPPVKGHGQDGRATAYDTTTGFD
jgi:hypothetical protein